MKQAPKKTLGFTAAMLLCLVIALFTTIGCEKPQDLPSQEKEPGDTISQAPYNISGTWKVKALSISGELTDIDSPPDSAIYPDISITIPDETQGFIEGHLFYNMIRFQYEISEQEQIRFYDINQYIENELIIQFEEGVDAIEFAANSDLGIAPKRLISRNFNIWLFETDGTKPLHELIAILSQDVNVKYAQYNHAGITLRDAKSTSIVSNLRNTVKFTISDGELTFLNSLDNPLVVFIKQ